MNRVDYESIVVQDVINLEANDELNLNPWYQRRAVWKTPQKAYLINSIFENKPVPTIYVRHYLDLEKEKSIKEVVDGQQRVRSVLEYAAGGYAARHPKHKMRTKYAELSAQERTAFKMTKLSVGYLIDADDADVIEIFGRLNSVSKTLNAQEKRNAAFSGEMKQFCLKQAASRVELWRKLHVFSSTEVARMTEVQFVSDLVLNMLDGLSDFSAAALDTLYKDYDERFSQQASIDRRLESVFSSVASLPPALVRDTIFSRIPIFFSLLYVIDSAGKKLTRKTLEAGLTNVDDMYNDEVDIDERPKRDAEFIVACQSSTQRIKSRRIRDRYLRAAFGLK
jgi:hypothetical protein